MNTLSEDHIDQSFCEDIETSWINLLIAERYAKYSEETGKYYIDIPDDLLFERFHHYYNEKDDLGKFFNIKQKEYISLRVFVYKLSELHSKKIS